MSYNQSRSDRGEMQFRKTGRPASFSQQRGHSRGPGGVIDGGPCPSPSVASPSQSTSSNRSFKRTENAQGAQVRSNAPPVSSSQSGSGSASRNVQTGPHVQPQLPRTSDAPVSSGAPKPNEPLGPQRSSRAVPKAPTSQPTSTNSENSKPATPAKAPENTAMAFSLQFGSVPPSLTNGTQIPARTSSAPPNLDEQKRAQASRGSSAAKLNVSTHVPKQQLQNKAADPSNTKEARVLLKEKKGVHVSSAPPPSSIEKSPVLSAPIASMQMPHHPPQVSSQFGTSSLQIQHPSVTAGSHQMPIPKPLQTGTAPHMPQPVLVPGLQSHAIPHQGIMHQGHGWFTPPMGPQLPPNRNHMGLGMMPQYPQQQGGTFGGQRKTSVKITHPETHEELKLDKRLDINADSGSLGSRPYPNIPVQSHTVTAFSPSHPMSYFHNSYNTAPMFFPSTSLPLTSSQMITNPQAPRFSYPVSQGSQNVHYVDSSTHKPTSVNRHGSSSHLVSQSSLENMQDSKNAESSASSGLMHTTSKQVHVSSAEKVHDPIPNRPSNTEKVGSTSASRPSKEVIKSVHQIDVAICTDSFSEQGKATNRSMSSEVIPGANVRDVMTQAATSSDSFRSNEVSSVPATSIVEVTRTEDGVGRLHFECANDNSKKPEKHGDSQASHLEFKFVDVSNSESLEAIDDIETVTSNVTNPKSGSVSEGLKDCSSELYNFGVSKDAAADTKRDMLIQHNNMNQETKEMDGESRFSKHNLEIETSFGVAKEPAASKSQASQMKLESSIAGENKEGSMEQERKPDSIIGISLSATKETADSLSSSVEKTSALGLVSNGIPESRSSSSDPAQGGTLTREVPVSAAVTIPHDKPSNELSRGKNTTYRGKKKRREILQKADAAGITSDLYGAYKGPAEGKADVGFTKIVEVSVPANIDPITIGSSGQDARECTKDDAEPDDWEDAADLHRSELDVSDDAQLSSRGLLQNGNLGNGSMEKKKYSRDFLVKFKEQFTELPQGFGISPDIADALMGSSPNSSRPGTRDSHSSPGRVMDRQGSGSRLDRRGSSISDDDRWNKFPGLFGPGRDIRMDLGYVGNIGLRPSQGGNFGVLRNPRAQGPGPCTGGILSGPAQYMGPQGGLGKNNPDADRWQRGPSFQQKGLIPSPKTPMPMMHRAEKKYEIGKVTDEEEAKQRRLKGILNKLTPQNFEKLFEQVKEVNIDNTVTLTGVISQIFDKALTEPTFCEMYANFCYHLAGELPDFFENDKKINFKGLLLNKCQEEFERGQKEEEEASKVEEGRADQSAEEKEEKRLKARRRMLGNIRLIGELYKKGMLTARIMHSCIQQLLRQYPDPDEEDIEALCKLMTTIGEMIDHSKAKEHIDAYFESLTVLSDNKKLSSRVRFMLKDVIDLRKNKWQQRRKIEGPKKIEEVHRDAAQERQAQGSRMCRGPGVGGRRGPTDFGPRGSTVVSSPNHQMGGFRGLSQQGRSFSGQDGRFDDRFYEPRTLSVPLSQRPVGDDVITLGPQGGLGRGMSVRGSPHLANIPVTDTHHAAGDSRRMAPVDGVSPMPERITSRSKEDVAQSFGADRQLRSAVHETSSQSRGLGSSSITQNTSSEQVLSEERLREMSMAAIKEYYSARDMKEVALCIRDLNSSSFHPTMISLWVIDSFERKDVERDLLAKLLIHLMKSVDGILSQAQLLKGFESVLTGLEDAVNDAPKAPEYLGRMFAKAVVENVISLREVGRLIREGGEEPGSLLEMGLGGDVLGSTLEFVKSEKGEAVMNEIRAGDIRLEDFIRRHPNRSKVLEKFIK